MRHTWDLSVTIIYRRVGAKGSHHHIFRCHTHFARQLLDDLLHLSALREDRSRPILHDHVLGTNSLVTHCVGERPSDNRSTSRIRIREDILAVATDTDTRDRLTRWRTLVIHSVRDIESGCLSRASGSLTIRFGLHHNILQQRTVIRRTRSINNGELLLTEACVARRVRHVPRHGGDTDRKRIRQRHISRDIELAEIPVPCDREFTWIRGAIILHVQIIHRRFLEPRDRFNRHHAIIIRIKCRGLVPITAFQGRSDGIRHLNTNHAAIALQTIFLILETIYQRIDTLRQCLVHDHIREVVLHLHRYRTASIELLSTLLTVYTTLLIPTWRNDTGRNHILARISVLDLLHCVTQRVDQLHLVRITQIHHDGGELVGLRQYFLLCAFAIAPVSPFVLRRLLEGVPILIAFAQCGDRQVVRSMLARTRTARATRTTRACGSIFHLQIADFIREIL